jgi:hypothetical protein
MGFNWLTYQGGQVFHEPPSRRLHIRCRRDPSGRLLAILAACQCAGIE